MYNTGCQVLPVSQYLLLHSCLKEKEMIIHSRAKEQMLIYLLMVSQNNSELFFDAFLKKNNYNSDVWALEKSLVFR